MKRPHRRTHLIIWLVLAPVTIAAGLYAWMQRPGAPYSDIPGSIETLDKEAE